MKYILLIVFLSCGNLCRGQKLIRLERVTENALHVFGNNFEGVVFDKDYRCEIFHVRDDYLSSFSPTTEEIQLAEKILQKNIKIADTQTPYPKNGYGPVVHKHLRKYLRQYFGFINSRGEKIIYLNALWKPNVKDRDWLKNYYYWFDGGSIQRSTQINLSTGNLSKINVHGVS